MLFAGLSNITAYLTKGDNTTVSCMGILESDIVQYKFMIDIGAGQIYAGRVTDMTPTGGGNVDCTKY